MYDFLGRFYLRQKLTEVNIIFKAKDKKTVIVIEIQQKSTCSYMHRGAFDILDKDICSEADKWRCDNIDEFQCIETIP